MPETPIPFVDLQLQYETIKAEVDRAVLGVIAKAEFIGGPAVKAFEATFAESVGIGHCIGVGNGTDAIFLALKALGIGQGDQVVTAANSFIASSEAISMTGAEPVFVDCDPQTYNMSLPGLERVLQAP